MVSWGQILTPEWRNTDLFDRRVTTSSPEPSAWADIVSSSTRRRGPTAAACESVLMSERRYKQETITVSAQQVQIPDSRWAVFTTEGQTANVTRFRKHLHTVKSGFTAFFLQQDEAACYKTG